MNKIISFCLYGTNDKYCKGMIENVILCNLIYIDWKVIVYVSIGKQSVPENILKILKNLNCQIIENKELYEGDNKNIEGMFWRFLPLIDKNVDIFISRDADSRVTIREKKMVDEWIESNKCIHSILDHCCHKDLMGGTFGVNLNILRQKYPNINIDINNDLKVLTSNGNKNLMYDKDQQYIKKIFKNIIIESKDIFIHYIRLDNIMFNKSINEFSGKQITQTNNFCGIQSNKCMFNIINQLLI